MNCVFFFQAEDGIRDLVRSRGLGDVYKRQLVPIARDVVMEHIPEMVFVVDAHDRVLDANTMAELSLIHI